MFLSFIQNNVLELWSLFDFLMPGFLGTERQFAARYGKPILASRDARSSSREQEAGMKKRYILCTSGCNLFLTFFEPFFLTVNRCPCNGCTAPPSPTISFEKNERRCFAGPSTQNYSRLLL